MMELIVFKDTAYLGAFTLALAQKCHPEERNQGVQECTIHGCKGVSRAGCPFPEHPDYAPLDDSCGTA